MPNSILAVASQFTHDAIAVFAPDGRLLDGNDRFREMHGYSAEELVTLTVGDLRSEATRHRWVEDWSRVQMAASASFETEHRRKDGSLFPVDVGARLVDVDGTMVFVLVMRDITERVRARKRIERLSRLYEAVSTSNRAVIFSQSEEEMFARICRACVDYGMRMAWVGMRESGKVVPCYSCGDGAEYLTGIEISADSDDVSARGPTGTAVRTGSYVICDDFQADPRTTPWHERGRRYGWRASAAFPLFRGGIAVGALTLYSDVPRYFGVDEARLIHELALDVSFALDRFQADRQRHRLEKELKTSRLDIIRSLGRAGEYRDNETGAHILRMSHFCQILADAAGLPKDFGEMLLQASPMHDVGKIGIPDAILLKPGKLEPHEFEIMKTHVLIGAEILSVSDDPLVTMAKTVALTHHEKWDGSGYPHGLSGEAIPIEGRIAAICDVYDALRSRRPYKRPWSDEEAVAYIRSGAGSHFDPALVQRFMASLPAIKKIQDRFVDALGAGANAAMSQVPA